MVSEILGHLHLIRPSTLSSPPSLYLPPLAHCVLTGHSKATFRILQPTASYLGAMSDLTPPASKHNTPQRNPETTTEMEAPASPTSMRGGSTAPAGDEIAAPGTDTVEAGPSGGPTTTDALDAGAVGAPGVEEAGQPSSGGMDIDEGDAGSETDDDRAGDDGAEKGDGDVAAVDENGKVRNCSFTRPSEHRSLCATAVETDVLIPVLGRGC